MNTNMRPSGKGGRRSTPQNSRRGFAPRYRPANNNSSSASSSNKNKQHSHQKEVSAQDKPSLPSWAAQTSDEEFWDRGYNSRGYDRQGFSRLGFNKHGFKRHDYGPDGFNTFGFDREGYNREGRNLVGLTRADYDVDGYDAYGVDCYGYDRQGLNKYGYSKKDYDANGLDKHGYTCQGLYHGVPGTALIPLRHAKVLRGRSDPEYAVELYERLKEHSALVILNAQLELQKLLNYENLITDMSLKWTAWSILYSLDLC